METISTDKSRGWKNILKIIVPYFLVVGTFQLVGFYFAGLDINYKPKNETTKELFTLTFFSLIGTALIVWIFRKYIDKKSFKSLGFEKEFIGRDLFLGIIFGFLIMFIGFSTLLFSNQISFESIQFHPIEFISSIAIFIFVAIAEELFLRGYILNNLMVSFNKFTALIISSAIFSLMHAANPNFNLIAMAGLFISGLLFGLSYIYTKNLWFPIALHFSWNFFQGTIFGFNVSGKDTYSLIVTGENTSNLWNGGSFGFEASSLSFSFQILAIIVLYLIFKKRSN
ncbi:MAG: type II CAAX endopeptidase family protein [Ginsengibacter sp.]